VMMTSQREEKRTWRFRQRETAPLYPATMDEKHAFAQTRALFLPRGPLLPEIMFLYPSMRSRTRSAIVRGHFAGGLTLNLSLRSFLSVAKLHGKRDGFGAAREEGPPSSSRTKRTRRTRFIHDTETINIVIMPSATVLRVIVRRRFSRICASTIPVDPAIKISPFVIRVLHVLQPVALYLRSIG